MRGAGFEPALQSWHGCVIAELHYPRKELDARSGIRTLVTGSKGQYDYRSSACVRYTNRAQKERSEPAIRTQISAATGQKDTQVTPTRTRFDAGTAS